MKFSQLFLLFFFFLPTLACAENTQVNAEQEAPGWFQKTIDGAKNIYDKGQSALILSGYAYHGRGTYTREKIDGFNEKAWGLGIGKVLRDENDNEQALQFLVFSDSHKKPQLNAVYSYQWMWSYHRWEIGAGYIAGLFSRPDIIRGLPFPAALPLVTLGTRDTKLVMNYVPRLSSNKGNGDVLYLALRIDLN